MSNTLDPQMVEEQSQAEQENYKVYKRRWLVLFAMFTVILAVGMHKALVPILDILQNFMHISVKDYNFMTQVSMYIIVFSVLGMAQMLEYLGLRRIAYIACLMIAFATCLKALCFCDERYVTIWIKNNRYCILLLSEVFVGLAASISFCIPPKVASAWFANYENTLALVIVNCGYNAGVGFSNYFTPILVKSVDDMYKLGYMFLISGCVVTFIVLTCVTRSSPKISPSGDASGDESTLIPLRSGLAVMLSDSSYTLALITTAINLSVPAAIQLESEAILKAQQYHNDFCGTLVAHSYFFGTFFLLMGGAWIDNSANFVKVSRISCTLCAITVLINNIALTFPGIKNVLTVTNIMASFGCSLMFPAMMQVCLRSASTILPQSTVAAIIIILWQIFTGICMNLIDPLKKLSYNGEGYQPALIIFGSILMCANIIYATSFRAPKREDLHRKLMHRNRDILVNEPS